MSKQALPKCYMPWGWRPLTSICARHKNMYPWKLAWFERAKTTTCICSVTIENFVPFRNQITSSRTGRPVRELVNHVRHDRELCPVPEPGSLGALSLSRTGEPDWSSCFLYFLFWELKNPNWAVAPVSVSALTKHIKLVELYLHSSECVKNAAVDNALQFLYTTLTIHMQYWVLNTCVNPWK